MEKTEKSFEIDVITPSRFSVEKQSRIPGLKELMARCLQMGKGMSLITYPTEDAAMGALAKRRHDLKAAMRTLELSVAQLESGYHFDDGSAADKIASMRRALTVIGRESSLLLNLLDVE